MIEICRCVINFKSDLESSFFILYISTFPIKTKVVYVYITYFMCIIQHVVHIFLLRLLWKREWTSVFTWWSKKVIWRRSYIKEMHIIIPFWWYSKTYISILGCVSIFSEVMVIRCYLHTLAIFLTYDRAMTTENIVLFMITLFWQKNIFLKF